MMHLCYQLIVDIFVANMNIERSVSEHVHASIAPITGSIADLHTICHVIWMREVMTSSTL